MNTTHSRFRALTLIELLVVIAIIAILAAMLLPALGTAKPHWALAADAIVRFGTRAWASFDAVADRDDSDGVPSHRGGSSLPAGANQVFADGSARWIKAADLRFLHSWYTGARLCHFFQDRQDMPASLLSRLDNANMKINP